VDHLFAQRGDEALTDDHAGVLSSALRSRRGAAGVRALVVVERADGTRAGLTVAAVAR
jgi:hypothetical protein